MILIVFTYGNLSFIRHKFFKEISYYAKAVAKASDHILNKSIVYVVKYSDNYLYGHVSNYAGINKEVVITENYEAVLTWFPLTWKGKETRIKCKVDSNDKTIILPDYVLIYGDQEKINDAANKDLKLFLKEHAFKCYQSTYGFCKLYRVLKEPVKEISQKE